MPLSKVLPTSIPEQIPADLQACFKSNRIGDSFHNPWRPPLNLGLPDLLRWKLGGNSIAKTINNGRRRPYRPPTLADPAGSFQSLQGHARVMWLGHASLLVQIDGITLLIDPVFGRAGGFVPRKAPDPLSVKELPHIDAVLLSHGHYDHLDAGSLSKLSKRFGPDLLFITPLGLSYNLPGICRRRVELDWWNYVDFRGVQLHMVPAQHWHRRTPFDMNKKLWGGWVIQGTRTIYHSGDTGFFRGFAAIAHVFDTIDLAVLPLGAYEPRWFMGEQHMAPEDSVQAFIDLGARNFMAMHWGTFDLTDEPLDHGARDLLPAIIDERGQDPTRFHVLSHGGSIGWEGEEAVVLGPVLF